MFNNIKIAINCEEKLKIKINRKLNHLFLIITNFCCECKKKKCIKTYQQIHIILPLQTDKIITLLNVCHCALIFSDIKCNIRDFAIFAFASDDFQKILGIFLWSLAEGKLTAESRVTAITYLLPSFTPVFTWPCVSIYPSCQDALNLIKICICSYSEGLQPRSHEQLKFRFQQLMSK